MNKNKLYTDEELDFFDKIESGNYMPLTNEALKKEKTKAKQIAKNTIEKMTKKKSLNLRIFEKDIENIKALALEKGLPYQTLLSSVIHQVATRQIKI